MEIFPGNVSGNISGNISTEINNRFSEIFPRGNFWEFFLKNSLSALKINIEILNSLVKMLKLC